MIGAIVALLCNALIGLILETFYLIVKSLFDMIGSLGNRDIFGNCLSFPLSRKKFEVFLPDKRSSVSFHVQFIIALLHDPSPASYLPKFGRRSYLKKTDISLSHSHLYNPPVWFNDISLARILINLWQAKLHHPYLRTRLICHAPELEFCKIVPYCFPLNPCRRFHARTWSSSSPSCLPAERIVADPTNKFSFLLHPICIVFPKGNHHVFVPVNSDFSIVPQTL
ncbi:hypothetical protein ACH5RR_029650 [Cinchona calisaya]|uniref:Uncharacterized protein n=1 Tax=Cinchona calisaya TaxID=153742 RepID=A0ABD2YVJ8_9GENT